MKGKRPVICAIVGVEEAKSLHEVAHCIANMHAYGIKLGFYERVEQIELAIRKAKSLPDVPCESVVPKRNLSDADVRRQTRRKVVGGVKVKDVTTTSSRTVHKIQGGKHA